MIVQIKTVFLAFTFLAIVHLNPSINARAIQDSPINTIVVPYHRNVVSGHPYQYPKKLGESRNVHVPVKLELVTHFNLDKNSLKMDKKTGMMVNFVDGAYPVYYMPSSVNGRFNGKISLLA